MRAPATKDSFVDSYVRQTSNYESQSPVMNASAAQVRCDELGNSPYSTGIRQVIAGETVGFRVSPNIQHPGPVAFYMAKAPKAHTAKTFDGDGDVWFKIAQEQPSFGPSQLTWPSEGRTELSVRIPQCIVAGEYLLRVEHLGLHGAYNIGGAQVRSLSLFCGGLCLHSAVLPGMCPTFRVWDGHEGVHWSPSSWCLFSKQKKTCSIS